MASNIRASLCARTRAELEGTRREFGRKVGPQIRPAETKCGSVGDLDRASSRSDQDVALTTHNLTRQTSSPVSRDMTRPTRNSNYHRIERRESTNARGTESLKAPEIR